jgi:hypothetical protein
MAKKDTLGDYADSLPDGLFLTALKQNRPRSDAGLSFLRRITGGKNGMTSRRGVTPRRAKHTRGRKPVEE